MITKKVDSDGVYGFQCTDLARDYCTRVHGISLGSFNGAAKNATYKKGGTLDPDLWTQHTPGPGKDLKQGDVVIINIGQYGHVGVVCGSYSKGFYILEQNTKGTGTGEGDDAILVNPHTWSAYPIINFYRKK